ncbi:MAG: hypothetical protein JXB05_38590 [Myxococcaceae bacterium]|nr:hypothetical protein [Myxococcaceae bacterium]
MKSILNILRNHRLVRPMTEEEAKSISLEFLRPMICEHDLAMKAALDSGSARRVAVADQASSSGRSVRSSSSSRPSGRQPGGGGLARSASPTNLTRFLWVSGV